MYFPNIIKDCSTTYPIYAKRPIKGTLTNIADPDQTPQNAASDQGLHCLHYIQEFLQNIAIVKNKPDSPSFGDGPVQRL